MTIKAVIEENAKHLKIDANLAKAVHGFLNHFKNKNADHVNALGSSLLGVYPMRWIPSQDQNDWIEGILGMDRLEVRRGIIALDTVDENWKRATDVTNLTCMWLAHKFMNSTLPLRVKEQAMSDVLMVYHCKIFSSLLSHYFPYGLDKGVAEAVYSQMSMRFEIKQKGSWIKVLEGSCEDLLSEESIHYNTLKKFDDDAAVIYLISDSQLKLRSKFKYYWEVLDRVRAADMKMVTSGGTIELNGELHVRDLERLIPTYTRYIEEVAAEPNRFMKPDLMDVVASVMPTMNENMFKQVLTTYSQCFSKHNKDCKELLSLTMEHLFNSVLTDPQIKNQLKNIASVVARTRGLYTSSRSSDRNLMQMRKIGEKFIKKECKITSPTQVSALRTGLLLYIVLRTMAKDHYA